ncbi:MAG: thermonuclease family protein [Candidatus Roizmanbacteria bacterium]
MKKLSQIINYLFLLLVFIFLSVPKVTAQDTYKVLKVIDGDTIQVDISGKKEIVRLLGIDTPETVDPRKPVQCFGKAASDKMKSFVIDKSVILVNDNTQENKDKYNRLLRYVYLPDNVRTFVNGEMIKQGYAFSYKQYPTKMLEKFNGFEKYAREHGLGLWGSCSQTVSPTKIITRTVTKKRLIPTVPTVPTDTTINVITTPVTDFVTAPSVDTTVSGEFTCSGKSTCGQMTSCAEANYYLSTCGLGKLDRDKDGIPCETLCN